MARVGVGFIVVLDGVEMVVLFSGINSGSVVTLPLVMMTIFSVAGFSEVVCTGTFGVVFVIVDSTDDNSSVIGSDTEVISID